jgi:glucose uptake protein
MMHAGKRQWLYAFAGGVVFNFANMLLLAAVSVGGMAVAFPIGLGIATIITAGLAFVVKPNANGAILFAGCALILGSVIVAAMLNRQMAWLRHEELAKAGKTKSTRRPSSAKAVILSVVAGVLMGSITQLIERAREGDLGLGPYALGMFFVLGGFFTTFVLNMFFMNLPVEGEPVEITDYFKLRMGQHALGLLGGALWFTAMLGFFLAAPTVPIPHVTPALSVALLNGGALIAALWGVLIWREFGAGDARTGSMAALMLALFACGLALMSIAATFAPAAA